MKSVQSLLNALTLSEKAALLEGYQSWMTNPVPRVGLPAIHLTDGPMGVRKRASEANEGMMGLGSCLPSTVFPAPTALANSWDPELADEAGFAIGRECTAYGVQVLLAPALNLKRDPRCGRNFEYFSEDPLLSGELAAAFTRGVQRAGIAACPKHFALNNCENHRFMGNSVADLRAMRELYLKSFEICVKKGRPRAMMCAYNQINGVPCSENRWLLRDVLRTEWGFDGAVITDWGATRDRAAGVLAGVDLDMPGGVRANRAAILEAAQRGAFSAGELDAAVGNVLRLILDSQSAAGQIPDMAALLPDHDDLATEMAAKCAVLLKNDGILPLTPNQRVLAVGDLFEKMRYQGAGSSALNPARLCTPKDAFDRAGAPGAFARGYRADLDAPDPVLEAEALAAAADRDVILFFGGLTETQESEGFDRPDMSMPENQTALIRKLCACGKPVVLILFGGAPMELPDADAAAILYMSLPGQGGGEACRRLICGEANPCGKLPETWMRTAGDIPCAAAFSMGKTELYRESIHVGYRYFDNAPRRVRFPFGHGLSYTHFEYSNLQVRQMAEEVIVSLSLKNDGGVDGAEVVQLYAGRNADSAVFKAPKQLMAFRRIALAAGAARRVELRFPARDLAYYHADNGRWVIENGTYPILVGASSRDIRLESAVRISGQEPAPAPYDPEVTAAYTDLAARPASDAMFARLLRGPIPADPPARPFTLESPLSDLRASGMGRLLYRIVAAVLNRHLKKINAMPDGPDKALHLKNHRFILGMMPRISPRALSQSSGGRMQMNQAQAMVATANGHILRALGLLLRKDRVPPLPCEDDPATPKAP